MMRVRHKAVFRPKPVKYILLTFNRIAVHWWGNSPTNEQLNRCNSHSYKKHPDYRPSIILFWDQTQSGGTGDEASVEPPEADCIPRDESSVPPDA